MENGKEAPTMRTSLIDMFRQLGVDPPEVLARHTMRLMYGAYLEGARKALRVHGGKPIEQALGDLEKEMGDSGTWDLTCTEVMTPMDDLSK